MSDFDDEPRGRSATGAVVIAVIFLALLGTGVGLVLGSQHEKDGGDRAAGPSPTATAQPTPTGTPKTTGTTRPPTNTGGSFRPTARDRCPDQTVAAAGTSLTVKRYLKTSRSEVWICSGGGKLYYQGHTLGNPFDGATTESSIFLPAEEGDSDLYFARNRDTTYYVGVDRLRIESNGVEQSNEPAVDRYEG
ncbi:hypothetical protein GCM10009557_15570 [Virgisporangium ochraceum]|uniref:Uncharacterized protein n=1 Tax=Virgisporangium ochraceum TaxID=65505 RepID=A0A8J3ZPS5_9ACTN|nr:hypothetical protein [Virgisporangium ochraceum]GIJ67709.1 hypothetical protein Voc01_026260 [Virgisporangium ochraceum]